MCAGSMPTAPWVVTGERWMEPKSESASCWKSSPVAPSRSCRQRSHETQNCGAGGDSSRYRVVSRYRAEQNRASAPAIYRRSEEHTSELQSLMRISYAVFCLKKKKTTHHKLYSKPK